MTNLRAQTLLFPLQSVSLSFPACFENWGCEGHNPKRKHVKNGILSPVEFERQQEMKTEGV